MRGFLVGILLLPLLVITVLSLRPGGLRQQLRFAARRLRLALVLAGVYLVGSAVLQLVARGTAFEEFGLPALAVVLCLVFVLVGQDPAPSRR